MTKPEPSLVIELQGVTRRFGQTVALDDVSLSLKEGEFFALLGPSGCGKTTLLRMIAGFEKPDSGSVYLDGQDITALRPNRRPVNMMFQSYALFPHMTVRANVSYGLEMEKVAKADIVRRVDKTLGITGLMDIASRKPDQLSGGQRQRVALARSLVKEPRVLLLDEPLAALDRKLRGQMQIELKRLQHELGITFVVVTHDQEEALAMADRIALMQTGTIVQIGSPPELYESPSTPFVADFIGVSNFLRGVYVNGQLNTERHGVIDVPADHQVSEHSQAVIAIRPEQLSLASEQHQSGSNRVSGQVIDTIYAGQSINAIVQVEDCAEAWVVRLDAGMSSANLSVGKQVWCQWDPQSARLLAD